MRHVELKKNIFWVGAVDFDNRNFHGYSESPEGTTYNAYLVKDEKNVLFDTVSASFADSMLARLSGLLPPEKVDYIVCHHLEADHAGSLARIVECCKPEKIFCSQLGLKSMQGHFDISNWPVQAVKNGESISIGSRSVQFFETRMLHWPDSMVSWLAQDKLLFSNDAFGQNIATTARFADEDEVKEAEFLHRVREYYYNIVLPYSSQVLTALNALGGLDIETIAPDHGLIFRRKEDCAFILDTYRRLAEQKPQKRALILYDTMWRSTEKMAYAVAGGLADAGVPSRIMSLKSNHHSAIMTELSCCGAVLAGSPTHNNGILPLVAATLTYMKGLRPLNRIGGAFGSFGWSGESPKILHEWLESMHMEMPAPFVKTQWRPGCDALDRCRELGKCVGEALIAKCKAEGAS
jgi:flavorubredoxin